MRELTQEEISQIWEALSLLNSMVNCGEEHSKQSIGVTKRAFEIINSLKS